MYNRENIDLGQTYRVHRDGSCFIRISCRKLGLGTGANDFLLQTFKCSHIISSDTTGKALEQFFGAEAYSDK